MYLCKYEQLVSEPENIMRKIYSFIEKDYPGNRIIKNVHTKSMNRQGNLVLSPSIETIVKMLYKKLENN